MIRFDNPDEHAQRADSNMMPMVDVIFTLIAFMMLIINAPQIAMDVHLPSVEQPVPAASENKSIVLTVVSDKKLWRLDGGEGLDKTAVSSALKTLVEQSSQQYSVLLEIDKQAPAQRVVDTLELLGELGIEDAKLMLDPAGK